MPKQPIQDRKQLLQNHYFTFLIAALKAVASVDTHGMQLDLIVAVLMPYGTLGWNEFGDDGKLVPCNST